MKMGRGTLIGALVVVLATPMVSAHASPRPLQHVERSYSFDGTGIGVLVISGKVDPGRGHGYFAQIAGDAQSNGGPPSYVYFPQLMDLGISDAHTYGATGQRDLCADPLTVCTAMSDGGLQFSSTFVVTNDSDSPSHVRFAIAVKGARVTFHDRMLGWHRHKLGSVHQVTDDTATGEGATAFGLAAGTTLSASAPSGRHGSIAVAAPPCDQLGAGVAVLTGPGVTDPQPCPTDAFADVTTKPGTWTMTGPAAGLSGRSTRLLVLDL